jgi:hypothetical protein
VKSLNQFCQNESGVFITKDAETNAPSRRRISPIMFLFGSDADVANPTAGFSKAVGTVSP